MVMKNQEMVMEQYFLSVATLILRTESHCEWTAVIYVRMLTTSVSNASLLTKQATKDAKIVHSLLKLKSVRDMPIKCAKLHTLGPYRLTLSLGQHCFIFKMTTASNQKDF